MDEKGVIEKFGVPPESIPDYLALVGDSADGFPGIKGWGASSTSAVLSRFKHIENIPNDPAKLGLGPGRARTLVENLQQNYQEALLFRECFKSRLGFINGLTWIRFSHRLHRFTQIFSLFPQAFVILGVLRGEF